MVGRLRRIGDALERASRVGLTPQKLYPTALPRKKSSRIMTGEVCLSDRNKRNMSESMSGPHLVAAFICERVLQERDGSFSFIRMLDRINVAGQTPQMQPVPFQAFIVVIFKAGGLGTGKYTATLQVRKPNGEAYPATEHPLLFDGGEDRGAAIINPFGFIAPEEGLYWIDVNFEGATLTRIAIRFVYHRMGQMFQPPVGR